MLPQRYKNMSLFDPEESTIAVGGCRNQGKTYRPPARKRSFDNDQEGVRVANAGYLREIDKPGTDSGKQELEAG